MWLLLLLLKVVLVVGICVCTNVAAGSIAGIGDGISFHCEIIVQLIETE